MKDLKPGDEVEFLVLECFRCKEKKPLLTDDSFFFIVDRGVPEGFLCSNCAVSSADRLLPAIELMSIMTDEPLAPPATGAFTPLPDKGDGTQAQASSFQKEMNDNILEVMATWHGKVLKLGFGTQKAKGLWIKPIWEGSIVRGLQLAGDTPSKGIELDIYQTRRLAQLGFQEEGATNKIWSITFQDHETGIANASAVISYVLRHGYLLDVADITSFTPTLDIDTADPEYQHLRPKRKR
jgi:hypothetical protein